MELNVDYAECRRIDYGDGSGYSLIYAVYNGDMVGTYRIDFNRRGELGQHASRDYHRLATPERIAIHNTYREWVEGDMEDDMPPHDGGTLMDDCMFHGGKACLCDGSYMVEVTSDDEKAYMIAAMMAERW